MRRKKTQIKTEREAVEYIENILKNWSSWGKHHKALTQSLTIILAKIKGGVKK